MTKIKEMKLDTHHWWWNSAVYAVTINLMKIQFKYIQYTRPESRKQDFWKNMFTKICIWLLKRVRSSGKICFKSNFWNFFKKIQKTTKKYEKFHFARKRLKIAQFWLQNRILREILALEHVYINIILNFNFLHFFAFFIKNQ